MHLITLRLLGVPGTLSFPVDDAESVWDALQEEAWTSFASSGGQTVAVRSAYVTTAALAESGTQTELTDDVTVYLVGSAQPLILKADREDWPTPARLLEDEDTEWLGWSSREGGPIMFQAQHLMCLIYPTEYDAPVRKSKKRKR